jgi:hypothetical protein
MTTNTETTNTTNTTNTETKAIKASTIRPGIMISVNTTLRGGVEYRRVDLDATGEPAEPGVAVARWETVRKIMDPAEYERATKARSQARGLIVKECQSTSFGDLCPEEREGALDAAIRRAHEIVAAFNAESTHTKIGLYVLKGRVASNDAEAARSITSEIAGLVVAMNQGIEALDAESVRKAASKARELSAMLDDSLKGKVEGAITQARKAARDITRRIEKGGEEARIVLADIQRGQIESARIAFLDLSDAAAPVEALPSVEAQRFADLDLGDDVSDEIEPVKPATMTQAIPKLDLAEGSGAATIAAPSVNVPAMELS